MLTLKIEKFCNILFRLRDSSKAPKATMKLDGDMLTIISCGDPTLKQEKQSLGKDKPITVECTHKRINNSAPSCVKVVCHLARSGT